MESLQKMFQPHQAVLSEKLYLIEKVKSDDFVKIPISCLSSISYQFGKFYLPYPVKDAKSESQIKYCLLKILFNMQYNLKKTEIAMKKHLYEKTNVFPFLTRGCERGKLLVSLFYPEEFLDTLQEVVADFAKFADSKKS